jgi:cytochrome c556
MVEISYLLDSPGLAIDDPSWKGRVAAFHAAAKASADAAEKHDLAALEKAGIALDRACVECHRTYKPEIEPPDPV